jgi:Protein of unknown function (DUF3304)
VTYPKVWAPYLTAKIRWTTSSSDPNETGEDAVGKWREQTVFIDEFFAPGSRIHLHFLPESKVQLIVSSLNPMQPDYPGPSEPEKPIESISEERFPSDFAPPKLPKKAAP